MMVIDDHYLFRQVRERGSQVGQENGIIGLQVIGGDALSYPYPELHPCTGHCRGYDRCGGYPVCIVMGKDLHET